MSASTPAVTVLIKKKVKRSDTSVGAGIDAGTSGGVGAKEEIEGANKKQKTSNDATVVGPTAAGNLPAYTVFTLLVCLKTQRCL